MFTISIYHRGIAFICGVILMWALFPGLSSAGAFGPGRWEEPTGAWLLGERRMRVEPYAGGCYPDKIISGGETDVFAEQLFTCGQTEADNGRFQGRYTWTAPPPQLVPGKAVPIVLTGEYMGFTPEFGEILLQVYFLESPNSAGMVVINGLQRSPKSATYDNNEKQKVVAPFGPGSNQNKITLVIRLNGSNDWYWEYDYIWSGSGDQIKEGNDEIQANWDTQANTFRGKNGQRFNIVLPGGGTISGRLWGTDIYTDDSSIGTAAVHAGLISADKGGTVTIEIRAGQAAYTGSTRNGVTSRAWGPYDGSFVFPDAKSNEPILTIPQEGTRIDWAVQANSLGGKNGQRFTVQLPPGGTISGRLWGTDIYTDDSSIGTAAVHAGLISADKGGTVTIEIRPGQEAYPGSVRHGVTSNTWGAYQGSFIFINTTRDVIQADWTTMATSYRGKICQQFTFQFPAGGTVSSRLWGTDIYTDDSSIGTAAMHAGLITAEKGGTVTIEIRAGQSAYAGSTRNGVTSSAWGAYEGSFVFVR